MCQHSRQLPLAVYSFNRTPVTTSVGLPYPFASEARSSIRQTQYTCAVFPCMHTSIGVRCSCVLTVTCPSIAAFLGWRRNSSHGKSAWASGKWRYNEQRLLCANCSIVRDLVFGVVILVASESVSTLFLTFCLSSYARTYLSLHCTVTAYIRMYIGPQHYCDWCTTVKLRT